MEIKKIYHIAESISKNIKEKDIEIKIEDNKIINDEVQYVLKSSAKASELLGILFSEAIPIDSTYYERLLSLLFKLGLNAETKKLIGKLQIETCKKLGIKTCEELLKLIIDDDKVDFFNALLPLPYLFEEIEIAPEFASQWFYSYANKIQGDLAGGDFFEAVKNYAFYFPKSGLNIIEKYISEEPDEIMLHLASLIFGAVRCASKKSLIDKNIVDAWKLKLLDNPLDKVRLIYHKSWVFIFPRILVTVEELEEQLLILSRGTKREIEESFNVATQALHDYKSEETLRDFSMRWLKINATSHISDIAKYYIVNSIWRVAKKEHGEYLVDIDDCNELIINIQPISLKNKGTLNLLQYYLLDRYKEDKDKFKKLFYRLIDVNVDTLKSLLRNDDFNYLISQISVEDASEIVFDLLFSTSQDSNKTIIGHILFEKSKALNLSSAMLNDIDEGRLRIAFYEFLRYPFSGEKTADFIILLEPRMRNASPELKKIFKKETLIQAINYPLDCLEIWRKINNPPELFLEVIKNADEYFAVINKIRSSPANSFSIPDFKRVRQKYFKEFSRTISEGIKEKSIFTQLAKNINIIYGNKWSVNCGEPTEFKAISHSMSVPNYEIIDPEGSIIRRMQLRSLINKFKKIDVDT